MLEEEVNISFRKTERLSESGLIISYLGTSSAAAELVVGRPGLGNFQTVLSLGDAALYETPEGTFEIRVLFHSNAQVELLGACRLNGFSASVRRQSVVVRG